MKDSQGRHALLLPLEEQGLAVFDEQLRLVGGFELHVVDRALLWDHVFEVIGEVLELEGDILFEVFDFRFLHLDHVAQIV